jgi:hypothetical protein
LAGATCVWSFLEKSDGMLYAGTDPGGDVFKINTAPQYQLTTNISGSGTGNISSYPSGIDCGVDCSNTYFEGSVITLSVSQEAGSIFTGWTGGGCSGTGDCVITMNADTVVTATFELCTNPPVRISRAVPTYYSNLQEAYEMAGNETIQSMNGLITENLSFDMNKSVDVEGGYDCDYLSVTGSTTINGDITVNNGFLTLQGIVLQ